MVNSLSTDSFLYLVREDAGPTEWPAASFPEYTDGRLHGFVDHLWATSNGNLSAGVSVLSGPGLYTLTVALARAAGMGQQPSSGEQRTVAQTASIAPALLTELRRRDCRGMGDDPTGPVRRGRLLQLIGAFTTLTALGATTPQRQKLAAACPFCSVAASLQVSLPQVTWRCFACDRSGGLREFAECLLTKALAGSADPTLPR